MFIGDNTCKTFTLICGTDDPAELKSLKLLQALEKEHAVKYKPRTMLHDMTSLFNKGQFAILKLQPSLL